MTAARSRFRDSLVVAQVAICLALLVASGLLLRSLWFVEATDPGFQTAHLYAASSGLTGESNPSLERTAAEQFALRLAELPDIQSVSACDKQPLSGMSPQTGVDGTALRVAYNRVGSQYFRTVGIPMIRGRDFTEAETKTNAPVAIVSEGTALRIWPGEEALGKTIQLADDGVARPGGWRGATRVAFSGGRKMLMSIFRLAPSLPTQFSVRRPGHHPWPS